MVKYTVDQYCLQDAYNKSANRHSTFCSIAVTIEKTNSVAPFEFLYVYFCNKRRVRISPTKPDVTKNYISLQFKIDLRNLEILSETRNEKQAFSFGDRLCFTCYRHDELHYTQQMPRKVFVVPVAKPLPEMYTKKDISLATNPSTYSVKYYMAPQNKKQKNSKKIEKVTVCIDESEFLIEKSAQFNNRLVVLENPEYDTTTYDPKRWLISPYTSEIRRTATSKPVLRLVRNWPVTFFYSKEKLCFSIAWKRCDHGCGEKVYGHQNTCVQCYELEKWQYNY